MILEENGLKKLVQIDFSSLISSFEIGFNTISQNSDSCKILSCENQYFSPVCSDKASFLCKHRCYIGNYCENNGECIQSVNDEPKCS